MILLSELSRRRIRSIQKLIRVDRYECVVVLRVDKEKVRCFDGTGGARCLTGVSARLALARLRVTGTPGRRGAREFFYGEENKRTRSVRVRASVGGGAARRRPCSLHFAC